MHSPCTIVYVGTRVGLGLGAAPHHHGTALPPPKAGGGCCGTGEQLARSAADPSGSSKQVASSGPHDASRLVAGVAAPEARGASMGAAGSGDALGAALGSPVVSLSAAAAST